MSQQLSDQYTILHKIGEGGMGTVYLAEDRLLLRRVAIKSLLRTVSSEAESPESRFQQEALALARLNHPNITHLYAFIPRQDTYWMVMEYVEGKTLEEWVKYKGRLSPALAVSILIQLLQGLGHAHRRGIIHRDLKPANVMISGDGEVKIMDFGIARIRDSQRLTQYGKSVGTLEYMAPEQIQGKEGDELTDIYAAGNILYELLTGHTPFRADTDYDLMKRKLEEKAIWPADLEQVPAALRKVVLTALDRQPQKRYADVAALQTALKEALNTALIPDHHLLQAIANDQLIVSEAGATRSFSPAKPVFKLPALKLSLPKMGNVPALSWPAFLQDKSLRLLAIVVLVCLVLVTGNCVYQHFQSPSSLTDGETEQPVQKDSTRSLMFNQDDPPAQDDNSGKKQEIPVFTPVVNDNTGGGSGNSGNTPEKPVKDKNKKQPPADDSKDNNPPAPTPTPEPEPPAKNTPVKIPAGRSLRVVLAEELTSELRERDGKPVKLYTAEEVVVDHRVIIRKGAMVTGKIVDVVPSGKRKKALIGFVILRVQAVDGSDVKLHSDRFRQQSLGLDEPAVYRSGAQFTVELGRGVVR